MNKTLIDREKLIEEMKDYLGCSEESCNGCDNEGICFSKIVYEQQEISLNEKISEIIEFMSNVDYGGEFNCAIDNHLEYLNSMELIKDIGRYVR